MSLPGLEVLEATVKIEHRRTVRAVSSFLLAVALASGQGAKVTHPLEGLSTQEYWTVYEVLQASGRMTSDTSYASVLLHEPPKDRVLAWKTGDSIPREADAMLVRKGQVIEARSDIAGQTLESWKEVKDVQAPMLNSE